MGFLKERLAEIMSALFVVVGIFFSPAAPEDLSQTQRPATETKIPIPQEQNTSSATTTLTSPLSPEKETSMPAPTSTVEKSHIQTLAAHQKLRNSLVNILCTLKSQGPNKPLTASGVVIDPRGIVLTNAHVAQYILLRDFVNPGSITCQIRQGSPAISSFEAELLYISPQWVERHKENIFSQNPIGTGENDYAFLLIGPGIQNTGILEFTKSFEFVKPLIKLDVEEDDEILIGAYPAGILDSLSINFALFPITSNTSIKKRLTFDKGNVDVISTGGSYLAQKGSSGGGVLNEEGNLIGIFVTSTQEESLSKRDLRAITLSHIERSLRDYGNISISQLVGSDPFTIANEFQKKVAPLLAEILIEELQRR